jgi:BolA protein
VSLEDAITTKLHAALGPTHLEVVNESGMHNVPKGSETHFKVVVVASAFGGKSPVQRHQMIYAALAEELQPGKVHALAITSRTPEEWSAAPTSNTSPLCLGGSKHG